MVTLDALDALWRQFDFRPNDAQREAILYTGGPLYLPTGPGSGKARVQLWRTVNLIACHGVDPQEIFLSTFTEKVTGQLREGIRALLGAVTNLTGRPYDVEQWMYVGTVHSLCQRILSDLRFFPAFQARQAPTLLDDLAQYFLVYCRRWEALTTGLGLDPDPAVSVNALFGRNS